MERQSTSPHCSGKLDNTRTAPGTETDAHETARGTAIVRADVPRLQIAVDVIAIPKSDTSDGNTLTTSISVGHVKHVIAENRHQNVSRYITRAKPNVHIVR